MKHFQATKNRHRNYHRGSILLMVLVAIILMTLTTATYLLLMSNELRAARYSGNHLQAEMLAQSGIEYLRVMLSQSAIEIEQQGGLLDNPDMLQDLLVIDDESDIYRGRFTVVSPDMLEGYYQNLRYGLGNESAKLNLNSLIVDEDSSFGSSVSSEKITSQERLLLIPGMNEAVADAILDWLDSDDSPRVSGAESSYYLSLAPAYQPSNGPLTHLDELLMIQGVTPELLYGVDANRNYQVDNGEQPRGALEQLDNINGQLNRGWSAYLTVHSSEKNETLDGEPKIDVNADDLESLHGDLEEAVGATEANFIIAYRQYGPSSSSSSGGAKSAEEVQPDFEVEAKTPIESLLDLIGASVSIEAKEKNPAQVITSPWKDESDSYRQGFADLLDVATVDQEERIAGRININQASRPVLLTIPEMTETLADQIISSRESAVDIAIGDQRHPVWLIAEGLVKLEEFKPMFSWITTGGDVFSGQVVGFFDAGTAQARVEVVLDRSGTQEDLGQPARLLSWHDLSRLGPGFSLTVLSASAEPSR